MGDATLYEESSERAVLAAVLVDADRFLSVVASQLRVCDYYFERHQTIYTSMLDLREQGIVVTLQTVRTHLQQRGALDDAGGVVYLAQLDQDLPDLSGVDSAVRLVVESAARRRAYDGITAAREELCDGRIVAAVHRLSLAQEALCEVSGREPHAQATRLADVEAEEVSWLWEPYIPLKKLSILEGDPGSGKSYLTCALATSISLGQGLPSVGDFRAGSVLIFTAEDGLGDTIRPRLDAMDADVSRIWASAEPVDLSTPGGLATIRHEVDTLRPSLVVIDPIVAYVGSDTDTYRANQVRGVMAPLAVIAEELGCAILVVRHLSKGTGGKAIYRGQGSIDFTAAARSVMLAGIDQEENSKRVLLHTKSNLAPLGPTQGYTLDADGFGWTGESDLTAADVLSAPERGSPLGEAEHFVRRMLLDKDIPSTQMLNEATSEGIAERTLHRAKKNLRIRKDRRDGRWYWCRLEPDQQHHCQGDQDCQDCLRPESGNVGNVEQYQGQTGPQDGQDCQGGLRAESGNLGNVGPSVDQLDTDEVVL